MPKSAIRRWRERRRVRRTLKLENKVVADQTLRGYVKPSDSGRTPPWAPGS